MRANLSYCCWIWQKTSIYLLECMTPLDSIKNKIILACIGVAFCVSLLAFSVGSQKMAEPVPYVLIVSATIKPGMLEEFKSYFKPLVCAFVCA